HRRIDDLHLVAGAKPVAGLDGIDEIDGSLRHAVRWDANPRSCTPKIKIERLVVRAIGELIPVTIAGADLDSAPPVAARFRDADDGRVLDEGIKNVATHLNANFGRVVVQYDLYIHRVQDGLIVRNQLVRRRHSIIRRR